MKSFIIMLLAMTMAVCVVGCGGCKPAHMDDRTYNIGCQALAAVDEYLDGKSSAKDIRKTLDELKARIEEYERSDYFEDAKRESISLDITIIKAEVGLGTSKGTSALTDQRNALAKTLGKASKQQ